MKQLLALVLVACMAMAATATTITVSFSDVDADDARAANWKLQQVNAERVKHEQEEFANVAAMLQDYIATVLVPAWKAQQAEAAKQQASLAEKWEAATDDQRTRILAILNE